MTASIFGFPVVESDDLTAIAASDVIDIGNFIRFQYIPIGTWTLHHRARARLARQARHLLLLEHNGQPPKSRRTKRGSKRLL